MRGLIALSFGIGTLLALILPVGRRDNIPEDEDDKSLFDDSYHHPVRKEIEDNGVQTEQEELSVPTQTKEYSHEKDKLD